MLNRTAAFLTLTGGPPAGLFGQLAGLGGGVMPKRKVVPFVREPVKTCWHRVGLQDLQPDRFVRVVTGIIAGQLTLFPFPDQRSPMR